MELAVNKIAKTMVAVAVMTLAAGCWGDKKPEPTKMADPAPIADPKPYVPPVTQVPEGGGPVQLDKPVPTKSNQHSNGGGKTKTAPASEGKAVAGKTYVVKSGDSLSKIAAHVYGKSTKKRIDAIKKANGLKSDVIRVGQKLKIPAA